jgi:hypothetical protein
MREAKLVRGNRVLCKSSARRRAEVREVAEPAYDGLHRARHELRTIGENIMTAFLIGEPDPVLHFIGWILFLTVIFCIFAQEGWKVGLTAIVLAASLVLPYSL